MDNVDFVEYEEIQLDGKMWFYTFDARDTICFTRMISACRMLTFTIQRGALTYVDEIGTSFCWDRINGVVVDTTIGYIDVHPRVASLICSLKNAYDKYVP
jgi:hypothetical protein